MFLTTSFEAEQKGCLAHLISKDLYEWEETEGDVWNTTSQQPEEGNIKIQNLNFAYNYNKVLKNINLHI